MARGYCTCAHVCWNTVPILHVNSNARDNFYAWARAGQKEDTSSHAHNLSRGTSLVPYILQQLVMRKTSTRAKLFFALRNFKNSFCATNILEKSSLPYITVRRKLSRKNKRSSKINYIMPSFETSGVGRAPPW
jgi:hypothetical protein